MDEQQGGRRNHPRRRSTAPAAKRRGNTAAAPAASPDASASGEATEGAASEATGASASAGTEAELLGPRALDGNLSELQQMLDRADAPGAAGEGIAETIAPPAITVENFPGLCMGASVLMSLSLHKIGFDPLTPDEGEKLTGALLKNAEAWDLGAYLGNPKVAAAADLLGCFVAILTPRIIADARKRQPKSPTQAAAADNDESLAPAA